MESRYFIKSSSTIHLWRRGRERKYSPYSFTTSALDGGEWSELRAGLTLPSGKGPLVTTVQSVQQKSSGRNILSPKAQILIKIMHVCIIHIYVYMKVTRPRVHYRVITLWVSIYICCW
jgi:hypothetical protein